MEYLGVCVRNVVVRPCARGARCVPHHPIRRSAHPAHPTRGGVEGRHRCAWKCRHGEEHNPRCERPLSGCSAGTCARIAHHTRRRARLLCCRHEQPSTKLRRMLHTLTCFHCLCSQFYYQRGLVSGFRFGGTFPFFLGGGQHSREFSKICKQFLKKIAKMHYFSLFFILAVGRVENLMNSR